MVFSIVTEVMFPTTTYALTSGPSQPEFSSFEPVGTTDMVNEFTGDFTYNLPLLEVPGPHGSSYPLSLSYHSGATPEEESSWVGYGWTLNAGAINRNTRGLPDDYKNQPVKYHNKMPANWTLSAGGSAMAELFSIDANFFPSGNAAIRYNNYQGFGYSAGVGFSIDGVVTLGYNTDNGEGSFSLNVNPSRVLGKLKAKGKENEQNPKQEEGKTTLKEKRQDWMKRSKDQLGQGGMRISNVNLIGSNYGVFTFGSSPRPTAISGYGGFSTNFTLGLLATPSFLPAGISGNIFGKLSVQNYEPSQNLNAYGYMYSANAALDANAIMDYHVEKESPYQKRDVFLGMPFNDADNFAVSGQEIGGGFRMYHQKIGHFKPNTQESKTTIINVGGEIEVGANWGGGVDVGVGRHKLTVSDWQYGISAFTDLEDKTIDEPVYFRFNNDLGGSWEHPTGDKAFQAGLKRGSSLKYEPKVSSEHTIMNEGQRSGRSSYIGYHTNADIKQAFSQAGSRYQSYSHRADIERLTTRSADDLDSGIGEIAVYNEQGKRYLYALPVYSKNEKNLQFGLQGVGNVQQNFLAYGKDDKTIVGEERNQPYASTYLLTEINTPDYIDRTLDGPSADDFGGYVKFDYRKVYGYGAEKPGWFQWRLPYTGLMYHRNSLSDSRDDLGSMSSGEKEITYLKSIETKTHIAKFFTKTRSDGKEAAPESGALTNAQAKGTKELEKLERIELYAIARPDKPIKTIYFNYHTSNQELARGVPNANTGRGKLTLSQVTFEYEGIQESQVSYKFGYQYPDFTQYPARYQSLGKAYANLKENPNYDPFNIDAWGNYQYDGAARYAKMQTWLEQNQYDDDPFDPAAWQLKTITLPSGGEIHVQYEQDDYTYVQDQPAHTMVSIAGSSGNKYYLNHEEIGIANDDIQALRLLEQLIRQRYLEQGHKMYFKFLYRLLGINAPDLSDCNAEYIKGYATIEDTGIDGGRVYITLAPGDQHPKRVCENFVRTQRAGNLKLTGDCDASSGGLDRGRDLEKLVQQLISLAGSFKSPLLCSEMNESLSYFRVPTPLSKKGGGIRVKRLLTFDAGLEGQPVLYGHEYDYRAVDPATGTIRSSGVATNEPSTIREESVLVDFIARKRQGLLSKIVAGKDLEQSEGPLGESVLPGPSVGYSRVTKRHIHSGETNPGFTVSEFYTARDYPIQLDNKTPIKERADYLPLPTGLINTFVNNAWVTQGFSFIINNMHGQPRRTASYGGEYDDIHYLKQATASLETNYEYFEPGEKIPMMSSLSKEITYQYPGKEVDITFAQKAVIDRLKDGQLEGDADVGILYFPPLPIPFVSGAPSLTYTETELYTHATTKVVRYPVIVKKVQQRQDGIMHTTENLAFNPQNGQAIATKTYDDFEQPYIQVNTSATTQYAAMGQKAFSESYRMNSGHNGVTITKEGSRLRFARNTGDVCNLIDRFTTGDLVALYEIANGKSGNLAGVFHVGEAAGNSLQLVNNQFTVANAYQGEVGVEIIRTARTNQLTATVGSITTHGYGTVSDLQKAITKNSNQLPANVLQARQKVADLLNAQLGTNGIISENSLSSSSLKVDNHCTDCLGRIETKQQDNGSTQYVINECNEPPNFVENASVTPSSDDCGSDISSNFCYPDGGGRFGKGLYNGWHVIRGTPNVTRQEINTINIWTIFESKYDTESVRNNLSNPLISGKQYRFIIDYNSARGNDHVYIQLSNGTDYIDKNNQAVSQDPTEVIKGQEHSPYVWHGQNLVSNGWHTVTVDFTPTEDCRYLFFSSKHNTGKIHQSFTFRNPRIYDLDDLNNTAQLCSFTVEADEYFEIDAHTGKLMLVSEQAPCYPTEVRCLQFCDNFDNAPFQTLDNVVAASAQTFSDDWRYYGQGYDLSGRNDYENGHRGKWRPKTSYSYYSPLSSASKNYEKGIFQLNLFNWQQPPANDAEHWLAATTTELYSPHGEPLQERNLLGIPSAAKFGYNKSVPYLTAQNASNWELFFESFEYRDEEGKLEEGYQPWSGQGGVSTTSAHSGTASWKLGDLSELTLKTLSPEDFQEGMWVKFWVKTSTNPEQTQRSFKIAHLETNNMHSVQAVAQTGEWQLLEAYVKAESGNFTPQIRYFGSGNVWLDDIRVQPADAQANTYVYDPATLRLLATFDDQHFGVYYQYNAEGKLTKKQRETERGTRTIQETIYNTPSE